MAEEKTMKSLKIAIVGQGYVGLPLARAFVESGISVFGIESNVEVAQELNNRESHIEDISNEILESMFDSGLYSVNSDIQIVSQCDAIILCVPTPLDETSKPDLSVLTQAVKDVAPHIKEGAILISESTSFPGTLRDVIQPLINSMNAHASKVHLATAPERVDPGNKSWNQRNTPRLIAGITEKASQRAVEIYSHIADNAILVSSPEIAESAKLLENSFRLVNIAFINEFAQSMTKLGINALEVIEAASTKPYGFMKFNPGIGAGGHCIPVDPVYLAHALEKENIEHTLLRQAISFNEKTFSFIIEKVKSEKNQPKKILLVGLSYKEGINDLRESPALSILNELRKFYDVSFYDDEISQIEDQNRTFDRSGYDLVLILVKQPKLSLNDLIKENVKVWNCTGIKLGLPGVVEIFDGSHV